LDDRERWNGGATLDRVAIAAIAGVFAGFEIDVPARLFGLVGGAASTLIVVAVLLHRWPLAAFALALTLGSAARLEDALHLQSACVDGVRAEIGGEVVDLPRARGGLLHFVLAVDSGAPIGGCVAPRPRRVRLAGVATEAVEPHERWLLDVRFKALRNFRDPGAFDYVRWAQAQTIDAAGTVVRARRVSSANRPIDFDRMRTAIGDRFFARGADPQGVLGAIAVGDARRVTPETWDLFRRTGTIHLLVVSGLQVTIFATAGLVLGRMAARLFPAALRRVGATPFATAAGILAALGYSALAGWSLPVVRACYMTTAGLVWWQSGRRIPVFRAFVAALASLLLFDPRAVADASVWLSFGAVAVLLAYFDVRRGLPAWSIWILAQAALFVAMAPLFAATVGQVAWLATFVNLAAVPFVSVVLTPLALLAAGTGFAHLSVEAQLLWLCGRLCDLLLRGLAACAQGPLAFVAAPDPVLLGVAAAAAWLAMAPLACWQRAVLVPLAFAAFHRADVAIPIGATRVVVLDVGQGLSVLVDTASHRLLYDAGARYPSGFDLGDAVVVPAIRATGAAKLDLLVVSHGDLDHRGGVDAVRRHVDVRAVLTGASEVAGIPCRRGEAWQWDGVTFAVLHPGPGNAIGTFGTAGTADNDASCVLSIRAAGGAALLPGDISARAESELVVRAAPLEASLLVVPHHGSKTSSTPAFLAAVAPDVAVASAGYRNRFGHPHPDVVARYRALGIDLETTIERGALTWDSARPRVLTPTAPETSRRLAAPTPDDG